MARRGSDHSVQNRFERVHLDTSEIEDVDPEEALPTAATTQFLDDDTRSIISSNNSPDIPFNFSINPYRGCEHGCSYCYARPTHEYLGYGAGLDFESRILVKRNAAELFRKWLARPQWQVEPIAMSGVTDPYQPCERKFRITREVLEVALECRQPMSLITKNALITRDLDILSEMATHQLVRAAISVTTLDADLARRMEPRTSTPEARLRAVRELSAAGIPVTVMVAPIIPGLNDSEIASILQAASEAGAKSAGFVMLRMPQSVAPIFQMWLAKEEPTQAAKIEAAVRSMRDGKLNSSQWKERQRGKGLRAEQIAQAFRVFSKRYGLDHDLPPVRTDRFIRPDPSGQLSLFS